MATNEEKPANPNAASAAPAGKKSTALLFAALALVLAAGGASWFFLGRQKVAAKTDGPKPVTILHLNKFIVNLADTDRDAYLRVGIDLGVTSPATSQSSNEGDGKRAEAVPEIRDAILSVLSTCHSGDLLTPSGKKQLKQNLVAALKRKVPGLGVRDVYFTDFLVQR